MAFLTYTFVLFPLMEMQSFWDYQKCKQLKEGRWGLTSPQVTSQFFSTMSCEFQLSKPSVLTVFHWELETAFMFKFVMVTFCE